MKVAVTGAYSYSGKYIAARLPARDSEVITLTGHPGGPSLSRAACESFR